jgi:hypothetical protein
MVLALNNSQLLRTNIQLVLWNRVLRIMAVGRHLFLAAALGLAVCFWTLVADGGQWQKGSDGFSIAVRGLHLCWGMGLTVLALLDARSRLQNYKRAKDLFFENGFKPRIARLYRHSRCQRDALRVAAKDLGLSQQLNHFYQTQGYRWYHIFPDFVFKKPWILFSHRYWRKTLFEPRYTSLYFLW